MKIIFLYCFKLQQKIPGGRLTIHSSIRVWRIPWTEEPGGLYSPWNSPGQNPGVGSFPYSRGSSLPRDQTQVSRIEGRFFTSWATREALHFEGEVRLKTRLKLKYLSCDYDLILVWTWIIFLPEPNKAPDRIIYKVIIIKNLFMFSYFLEIKRFKKQKMVQKW